MISSISEKFWNDSARIIFAGLGAVVLFFFIASFILVAPLLAHADQPVVTLEPGYGSTTDEYRLVVTVSGTSSGRLAEPTFEASDNFEITHLGTNTRNQFVNGEQSFQISFSYLVNVKRNLDPGEYQLPAGRIRIDGKDVLLQNTKLTILAASATPKPQPTSGAAAPSPSGLDFTQIVDNEAPYVGEQILYRAEIAASIPVARANLGDISYSGFWRESFGKNQERRRMVGTTAMYSILDALFPTSPGKMEMAPRALDAEVRVPRPQRRRSMDFFEDLFDDLDSFQAFQTVSRHLTAPAIQLDVKELPPPPRPNLGAIPVGEIQVSSKVDQKRIKQGESVNLTIEVFGDGNLRPFELPKPVGGESDDFTTYTDQPKIETTQIHDRIFFKKTFQMALIPQKTGKFMLPTFEIVTFDPKAKQYKILHTEAASLEVLPGKGNERLIVKGGTDSSPTEQQNSKEEVTVLGQDLYPLHLGAATYTGSSVASASTDLYLLLFAPLLSGLLAFSARKSREAAKEPDRVKQRNAASIARKRLAELGTGTSAAEYLHVLRAYLGDRLRVPGESLTSDDAHSRLVAQGLPEKLSTPTADLLRSLQRAVYGGTAAQSEESTARVKKELENLITEIERYGPK